MAIKADRIMAMDDEAATEAAAAAAAAKLPTLYPEDAVLEQSDLHYERVQALVQCLVELGVNPIDYEIITERNAEGQLKSWFQRRTGNDPA